MRGRRHLPAHLHLAIEAKPEVHIARCIALPNGALGELAIQPGMDRRGRLLPGERNFAIGERTRRVTLRCRRIPIVSGIQVVLHHAYFSSRRAWSASRARWTRILSAPTVVVSRSAISSYEPVSYTHLTLP